MLWGIVFNFSQLDGVVEGSKGVTAIELTSDYCRPLAGTRFSV